MQQAWNALTITAITCGFIVRRATLIKFKCLKVKMWIRYSKTFKCAFTDNNILSQKCQTKAILNNKIKRAWGGARLPIQHKLTQQVKGSTHGLIWAAMLFA